MPTGQSFAYHVGSLLSLSACPEGETFPDVQSADVYQACGETQHLLSKLMNAFTHHLFASQGHTDNDDKGEM